MWRVDGEVRAKKMRYDDELNLSVIPKAALIMDDGNMQGGIFMSKGLQARRLALSVAVALSAGGGAFFPVMPHASAADVSGRNVTVNSPTDPLLTAPGISGGEINSYTNAGNVTNNTLTLDGVTYNSGGPVHGGVTIGTGNAQGNKLFLKNGADVLGITLGGTAQSGGNALSNEIHIMGAATQVRGLYIAGGMTNGPSGNAGQNKAVMSAGTAARLYGGLVAGANSTGNATGNTVTLSGGTVTNNVAGGTIIGPSAGSQGTGNVTGNKVTITGGTVGGTTYGGTTQGTGSVKSNTVDVSGTATVLHDALGGSSLMGDASENVLKFKQATADNLIGGRVSGSSSAGNVASNIVTVTSGAVSQDVRGGEIIAPTATGKVSANKVTINNGTVGGDITGGYNMGKGKTDGNIVEVANGNITGRVIGGHGTHAGEVSGNKVTVNNGTIGGDIRGGFAENTGTASQNTVEITAGTLGGSVIDGGYSVAGKASGNTATVAGVPFTGNVTGGRGGTGADTNKVFLKSGANITGSAYGGRVLSGGNVSKNELTIEASGATVTVDAVGGQNDAVAGDVTENKAYMRGGSATRLVGGVVNGAGASGKASDNRAEVSGGSSSFIAGALISHTGAAGEVKDNHAVVTGASAAGNIYGGITNGTGAATGNTAKVSGAVMVNGDVVGGQSATGNAKENTAEFTQATANNVRGARIAGNGAGSAVNNKAKIAGGSVTGAAAGAEIVGASATGGVQDNTLTITGGTVSGDSLGGITYGTGDAVHNGAVVSGGSTILTNVYGGSAASGNVTKNYVTFADASAQGITVGRVQSGAGTVSENKAEMTSGSIVNGVTGGLSYGSGTVEKNEVKISGGTVSGVILGGQNAGTGAASSNTVELTGGTINATVYGGSANSGAADSNKVTVKKDVTGSIFGGRAGGSASGNTVNLDGVSVSNVVWGGFGSVTDNNTVNMKDSTVGGVITVGSAGGTGNTLTVSGTNSAGNITGFQKVSFDLSTASTTNPMLNITNGLGTSFDWGALNVSNAEQPNRLVLMQNMAGISLGSYTGAKSVSNTDDTTEFNIDTENHTAADQRIVSESYKYRLQNTPVEIGTDVFGGISKVANSTRENKITVSGSYTNAYGGHTDVPLTGTGTTKTDRDNSYKNTITLSGGSVSGTVYGGYTTAATGKTWKNTVNVTGGSAANVVGAYSAGDATGNTVNVTGGNVTNVTGGVSTTGAASKNTINLGAVNIAGNVTGGQGATATNDNKVTLEGNTTVGGILSGGSMAGTGNTLTVKGNNSAGNITNFQKVKFDLDSASNPATGMLSLTNGAATNIDWSVLAATGTATGARTLLSNANGFGITGYTTDGTFVSETDEHEYFIDTDTHNAAGATKINLDDYQFKGAVVSKAADPNDTWAGRSKRGNTTQDNTLTITGGTGTNAYGGWTSTGSTTTAHTDKFDSKNNTVNLNGGTLTNVYGGYTDATAGKATKNTVNVKSGSAVNVVGGYSTKDATENIVNISGGNVTNVTGGVSTTGVASKNTINLGAVNIGGNVTGGQGITTTGNKINVEGTTVVGSITGGSAGSTDNVLTVKKANTAGSIAGFAKLSFDTDTATTNPMLTLSGGASTLVWDTLETTGTSAGPITLLHNGAGMTFTGYDGAHSRSDTDDTTEYNIDTVNHTATDNDVVAESYRYRGQTHAVAAPTFDTAGVYGGISQVGNATRENKITVSSGSYTNAYGGYTHVPANGSGKAKSSEKENSHDNKITIAGANISGTVYGGYTDATAGKATKNTVNVKSGSAANVVGGYSTKDATENIVNISGGNVTNVTGSVSTGGAASKNTINLGAVNIAGNVTGGQGVTTKDNKINVEGTTVVGSITGGSAGGAGHVLTVKKANTAGSITGFGKLKFDVGTATSNPMLTLNGGASTLDWGTLEATGTTAGPITLMKNSAGISFGSTYDGAISSIDSDDTTEFNIDTENRTASDNKVIAQSYQYRGQTNAVTTIGTDVYGGISRVANATRENDITVSSGSFDNAYGGYTDSVPPLPGSDVKARSAERNHSHDNKITIDGATVNNTVYGGYTNAATGKATKNTVNVKSGSAANVVGGYSTKDATENIVNISGGSVTNVTGSVSTGGAASKNTINLDNVTVGGNVTGGSGAATEDNIIHLNKTTVTGSITGGTAASGTGNTLVVHPGASKAQSLAGIQNINFFLDDTHDKTAPILELTTTGTQNLQGVGVGVGVINGAHPVYRVNERFSLIKVPGGTIQTDSTIQNTSSAMQGTSLRYEFDVAQTAANEVSAVVKKAELIEQTKSFVETRVGATAFINQGTDFLVANNIRAAKGVVSAGKADEAAAPKGYQLWASIGGSHMRSESGSYVDTNGWHVGVGWARENVLKDGNVVYGPFLSYGNASYDSYLNDDTHGSGKFRTIGFGVMARFEKNDGMWYEGSLQGGRVKSDYDGSIYAGINSSYDVSNTYWSGHLGAGKDIQLKDDAKITPYLRYFWSHQGGVSAHLSSGEDYDFSEVTSHRTRLGFRYARQNNADGEFYAGLAWEYEFSGSAHASYQGYDTPSPSLKGSSGMLELGYRFMPTDGKIHYDLRFTGWQGKRRGLSGDLSVKWQF